MAAIRHPCVGDLTYGADPTLAARLGLDAAVAARRTRSASRTRATAGGSSSRARYPADLQRALDLLAEQSHEVAA